MSKFYKSVAEVELERLRKENDELKEKLAQIEADNNFLAMINGLDGFNRKDDEIA